MTSGPAGERPPGAPTEPAAAVNGHRRGTSRGDSSAFWCRATTHGDWQIVELEGNFDWTGAAEARGVLASLRVTPRTGLAIDLRRLTFMDSTGIRLILQALHLAEERGARFAVIRGPQRVHAILEMVGLDDQLHIVGDADALG